MNEILRAKIRPLGTSACVLIPKERLEERGLQIGDEVEVALLKHKSMEQMQREIEEGFGLAKHFTKLFERDKKTREF